MTGEQSKAVRNGAIDGVKGIAIISVLLIHSLPQKVLTGSWAIFHIQQAVPILIVLMAYTGVLSRVRPLGDYLRRKAVRLLVPWGAAWLVSLVLLLLTGQRILRYTMLLGALPGNGPGNYFIAIALQFVLVLPVLRWLLDRNPWVFIVTCLAIDLSFQLLSAHFGLYEYLFRACLLRYLFAMGLGMLLASSYRVWLVLPFSLVYLVAGKLRLPAVPFRTTGWWSQSLLAAGYPVALVAGGLRLKYPRFLQALGRASWHIFLVQIIWFDGASAAIARRLGLSLAPSVVLSVLVCLAVGVAFARVEQWASAAIFPSRREPAAPACVTE